MKATWVLVADAARARLFETRDGAALDELGCYTSAESRAGLRGQNTDRPPTVNESVGCARHALEPHTDPRTKAAHAFAHTLRDVLDRGRNEHRFEQLILIAPPRFLGALHGVFDDALRDAVTSEIQRDLTRLPASGIRERLFGDAHGPAKRQ